jgi:arylsulfatase A-like enzyme
MDSIWGGPHGKNTAHELGLRTPIVLRWPGVVPAGGRSDALVSTVDLFPTLLDYAAVPLPQDRSGRSLRPVIEGGGVWERDRVIGVVADPRIELGPAAERAARRRVRAGWFVTTGDWWYIRYPELDVDELYDLREGPRPRRDLASEQPELVARLRAEAERWLHERRRLPQPLEGERRAQGDLPAQGERPAADASAPGPQSSGATR